MMMLKKELNQILINIDALLESANIKKEITF